MKPRTLVEQLGVVYVLGFAFETFVMGQRPPLALLVALFAPLAFYAFVSGVRWILSRLPDDEDDRW